MKKIALVVLFICACMQTHAQVNYVLNPSFEVDTGCPFEYDQAALAVYWQSIDTVYDGDSVGPYGLCAPELCNTCATAYIVAVPANANFYQYPRTGNALMQLKHFLITAIQILFSTIIYKDIYIGL